MNTFFFGIGIISLLMAFINIACPKVIEKFYKEYSREDVKICTCSGDGKCIVWNRRDLSCHKARNTTCIHIHNRVTRCCFGMYGLPLFKT